MTLDVTAIQFLKDAGILTINFGADVATQLVGLAVPAVIIGGIYWIYKRKQDKKK